MVTAPCGSSKGYKKKNNEIYIYIHTYIYICRYICIYIYIEPCLGDVWGWRAYAYRVWDGKTLKLGASERKGSDDLGSLLRLLRARVITRFRV